MQAMFSGNFSPGISDNRDLMHHFSRIMDMEETGVLSKMREDYWPRDNTCKQTDRAGAIQLDDIQSVFYLLFAILGLASCVLIIEILVKHLPSLRTTGQDGENDEAKTNILRQLKKRYMHKEKEEVFTNEQPLVLSSWYQTDSV